MKLKKYLEDNGLSISDFAECLGTTYCAVRQYVNAARVPKPAVMRKIVEITNGAVQPNDFFTQED